MRRFLLIALCLPAIAAAQGVRFDQYNMTSANNVPFGAQAPIFTLPSSTVTVCAYPDDGGQPCGNVIPIYSDPALTQTADNPITADVHGRFGFWLAPGTYTYSVMTQGGLFAGTYIFTLGGSGGGSGCLTTGITAGDLLFPNSSGNCLGSDNMQVNGVVGGVNGADTLTIKTPASQPGDDFNLILLSALDSTHNDTFLGPHLWQMDCTNSGTTTLGCGILLNVNDSGRPSGASGGLTPLYIKMRAEQGGSHPNYVGVEIEQHSDDGLDQSSNNYVGFNIDGFSNGVNTTYNAVRGYVYQPTFTHVISATDFSGFAVLSAPLQAVPSNYCDFRGQDRAATPNVRETIGCGPAFASTFYGNVTAPMYQETLTTPASSSAACTAGQFTDDASFHYVCTATNTWKRVALSSF